MALNRNPSEPGLGNLLLGYFVLGLQPLPVVLLAREGFGSAESMFARFLFAAVAIATIVLLRRRALRTEQPRVLFLRGLLGGTAVLLYFYSLEHAGAARGTLLNYTYPIWANLFAAVGGKSSGKHSWWGLGGALLGVALIVLPEHGLVASGVGWGELAGLASAVLAGGAVLTIKKLRETDESLTIIMAFSAFGLLMSGPFVRTKTLTLLLDPHILCLAVSVGVAAFFGHFFFTRGYRGVSVPHATLLSLSVPVVASLSGVLLLSEPLTVRFVLGAVLVLASSVYVLRAASPREQA